MWWFQYRYITRLSSPFFHLMSTLYLIPMICNPTRLIGNFDRQYSYDFLCRLYLGCFVIWSFRPPACVYYWEKWFYVPDVSNVLNIVFHRLFNQNNADNMYNLLSSLIYSIDLNVRRFNIFKSSFYRIDLIFRSFDQPNL